MESCELGICCQKLWLDCIDVIHTTLTTAFLDTIWFMLEKTRIIQRTLDRAAYDSLIVKNVAPLLAKIIAGRPLPQHEKKAFGIYEGKLADLSNPFLMKDMDKAAERVRQAILKKEVIAIETDHDCDGQTSHAVLVTALRDIFGHPADRIQSYIGHRLQEGYGLSDALATRILENPIRPTLVITADNGSADEPRIARLKAEGIDVIVTDHHGIPAEGIPHSAFVCLNPTREDCDFPDPYIAGCMVAWLLMAATRRLMLNHQEIENTRMPITELLDFVAVGTVADCVSLARSINNRVVVQYGLTKINQFTRPCWQAIRPLLKNKEVTSEDIGFLLAPLLNSDGRLSDALGSVNFLLSDTVDAALPLIQALFAQNEERKRIQKELTRDALAHAEHQALSGKVSLVIYLEDGHAGVHGISASRIKDQFGRPTIIFSPKLNEEGILTGSCRSIDAIHIRDVLQAVADEHPDVLIKFGGHKAAAGLSIALEHLDRFTEAFERAVSAALGTHSVGPVFLTDGLWEGPFHINTVRALQSLQPFGREFDEPLFELNAHIHSLRRFGQTLNHLELILKTHTGELIKGIWFGASETRELPGSEGDRLHLIFSVPLTQKGRMFEINIKYATQTY